VIATDPALHEIRSYHMTRIVAEDSVAQELPLVVRGTGPWNKQDYEYWPDDPAVDLIAQQNSVFEDIGTAARDPQSPAPRARDARFAAAKRLHDPDDSAA
jgi:hypothetical protein